MQKHLNFETKVCSLGKFVGFLKREHAEANYSETLQIVGGIADEISYIVFTLSISAIHTLPDFALLKVFIRSSQTTHLEHEGSCYLLESRKQ